MAINVTRSSMPPFEEYCNEIKEIWDSRWLTNMGVKHQQLQKSLEEFLNVPCVTLYTNGHLALENAIAAMDFPAGSEVITTPFTFASTTHAITRNGLKPVFCDVRSSDYTLDPDKIPALITEKTVAIVPVHVYGNLCDVDAIQRIADQYGLKVIYDAAHAFGVTYNGVSSACFGDASMFSFHATKVFHTIEGGAVCYKNGELREKLDAYKNFGQQDGDCIYAGGNAKMNEFQASMGICNLRHLGEEIQKRKMAALRYRERLEGTTGIRLCAKQEGVEPNYAYFPVVFDGYKENRDQVFEKLQACGIIARKYFSPLTNSFACYSQLGLAPAEETPVAYDIAAKVLTLPLYAGLELEEVDRICDIILN